MYLFFHFFALFSILFSFIPSFHDFFYFKCVCVVVFSSVCVILSILPFSKVQSFSLSLVRSLWFFNGIGKIILQGVCVFLFSHFVCINFSTLFHNSFFTCFSLLHRLRVEKRKTKLNREDSLVIARGTKIKEG